MKIVVRVPIYAEIALNANKYNIPKEDLEYLKKDGVHNYECVIPELKKDVENKLDEILKQNENVFTCSGLDSYCYIEK